MRTQHTPGPWTVQPHLTPEHDDDPIGVYRIKETEALEEEFLSIPGPDTAEEEERLNEIHAENAANARLIASAPELLEAAQAMMTKLHNMTTRDFEKGYERPERHALEAIISKATEKGAA